MMRWIIAVALCFCAQISIAQDLAGLARASRLELDAGRQGKVDFSMQLTQPVPYSVATATDPMRVILRFNTVSFPADLDQMAPVGLVQQTAVTASTADMTELSFFLNTPAQIDTVQMLPDGRFNAVFEPVTPEIFAEGAEPESSVIVQETSGEPKTRNLGDRPWVIALDPGHGGLDPGADGGRKSEADLMLLFSFELRSALRDVGFDVVLTRDADVFVGLEERLSIARDARADVFLSLHADAVVVGMAEGVTIYTLSDKADSEADAKLAARHERHDILAGVNLEGQGDEVAQVLLDMVRRDTRPRSKKLAEELIAAAIGVGTRVNSKPLRRGDFAVLRAADIPSVLIELGFLSSPRDLERLNSANGRADLIQGIVAGLQVWGEQDAAAAALIRQ